MNESFQSSLLKDTIRYHEERGRDMGILRCELWLSTGEAGPNEDEQVYCWPQRDDTKSVPRNTLEETVATHTWPNNSVWNRSYDSLISMLIDVRIRDNDPSHSQWIVSIPTGLYRTMVPSLNGNRLGLPKFRGVVCWLGDFTTKFTADNGSRDLNVFLEIASSQIAQTCAYELYFTNNSVGVRQGAPLQQDAPTQSSERNQTRGLVELQNAESSASAMPEEDAPEFYEYDESKATLEGIEEGPTELECDSNNKTKNTRISLLDEYDDSIPDCTSKTLSALQAYFRKYKGGGQKGPMPLCWRQVLFTFVGSFFTIFFTHISNQLITRNYINSQPSEVSQLNMTTATTAEKLRAYYEDYLSTDEWVAFQMGPFGATCVLVFAMTSVPASQPRNLLFGASIGMVVGKVVGYMNLINVGLGVRMSLAVALTASIMAATGILYPPGAALAIIFTSQLLGWEQFLLQAIGTVLTFSLGVIINNLHPLRIYPNFWLGVEPKELCKKKITN